MNFILSMQQLFFVRDTIVAAIPLFHLNIISQLNRIERDGSPGMSCVDYCLRTGKRKVVSLIKIYKKIICTAADVYFLCGVNFETLIKGVVNKQEVGNDAFMAILVNKFYNSQRYGQEKTVTSTITLRVLYNVKYFSPKKYLKLGFILCIYSKILD